MEDHETRAAIRRLLARVRGPRRSRLEPWVADLTVVLGAMLVLWWLLRGG